MRRILCALVTLGFAGASASHGEDTGTTPNWRSLKPAELRELTVRLTTFREVKNQLGKPDSTGSTGLGSTIRYKISDSLMLWFNGPTRNDLDPNDEKRLVQSIYLFDNSQAADERIVWKHFHKIEPDRKFRSDQLDAPATNGTKSPNKSALLTPAPPRVQSAMTIQHSTRSRSRAQGQV